MTYTLQNLKDDVRKEAEALKVHATKEELGRLDIETMDPAHEDHCIYGQMTGECDSDRALRLIGACSISFYEHSHNGFQLSDKSKIANRWSALEAYITLPEARNANLIAYLKGETETLEL